jgi:hypothetical protein
MKYNTEPIVEYLMKEPKRRSGVSEVSRACHIKNWTTTLAALLELTLEGRIVGVKTSGGWYFSAKGGVENGASR